MTMTSKCQLCQESFSTRKELVIHERTRHRNNKIIPHRYLLIQPPFEQIMIYQDAFIILIKKHFGFNRHSFSGKQGEVGEQRLKQLINYDYWNVQQNLKLKTKGYVLFMDNDSSYKVTFSWTQLELKENDRVFNMELLLVNL
ncbi:hypothetical protein C2G38_2251967 [Gigaspora rosea]|uniref:C2H2-type domain-containing protein n=1 Tax=Gigaspora rosea TaxID=44941 RepID=A0A397UN03_9GLOM|nr:hypothetical protein C2G38_2251967 [Gigaspora rosea]